MRTPSSISGALIAEDSLDEADRRVDRLDEKLDLLATQPLMGRARDELLAGLRSFPFARYVIFYLAVEDGTENESTSLKSDCPTECACCSTRI
jgi:plasmid stabilization system protein ParE